MHYFIAFSIFLYTSLAAHSASASTDIADTFDEVIAPHVIDGHVYYNRIDNEALDGLLDQIDQYSADADNDRQTALAFYLNAYNALTIKGIKNGGSPHSFFSRRSFFKGDKYGVSGENITLDTLEHKIIRPLKEPRIHFALVCAALSCPPLRSEAYRAERLDKQLDDQAIIFINNPDKNQFDLDKEEAGISSIFKWFKEDFTETGKTLSEYIAPFVSDATIQEALAKNQLNVRFKKYSWSLNGDR